SPIGHAIAGATIAWAIAPPAALADPTASTEPSARFWTLTAAGAALAAAPDLDLAFPGLHRTVTHSLTAVALITILTIVVTGGVTRRWRWRVVLACAAAYASHVLMDWMAFDGTSPRGIQMLWPFSDRWMISDWDLFRGTARRDLFTVESMRTN